MSQGPANLGVGAVAQPLHKASRQRHDVLQRAAHLSAHNIVDEGYVEVLSLKEVLRQERGEGFGV